MHPVIRQASVEDFDIMMRLCRHHGESIEDNAIQWQKLWGQAATRGVVLEDLNRQTDRALALMVGAFVTEEFFQSCATSYDPFVLDRISRSSNAFVTPQESARLNAGDGHHLMVAYMGWQGPDYSESPAANLRALVVNSFTDRHGGNRLKWVFGEVSGASLLALTLRAGCRIVNSYDAWYEANQAAVGAQRPYLMGVSHSDAMERENHWLQKLFTYFPPKFYFTEPQRKILLLAREGYTDAEIGAVIGVSADAVKKRWGAIYDRVTETFPHLLPESPMGGRGAEKRRALLNHLRERPEELRPFDRRYRGRNSQDQ